MINDPSRKLKFNGKFEHSCEMCQNHPFYFGIHEICQNHHFYFGIHGITWWDYSRNVSFIWNFVSVDKTWNFLFGFINSRYRIYLPEQIMDIMIIAIMHSDEKWYEYPYNSVGSVLLCRHWGVYCCAAFTGECTVVPSLGSVTVVPPPPRVVPSLTWYV